MSEEQKPWLGPVACGEELAAEQDRAAKKKVRQHEAWLRWYRSPKGDAFRARRRAKSKEPAK